MKRKISYISALLVTMFTAGCQKDVQTTQGTLPADGIIRVTVGVGETRAMSTDYVSQNGFGLFVGSTYANKLMTKQNGVWNTQDGTTMFWNGSDPVAIKAYAPWKADATATSVSCDVSSDQSEETNFSVSDLVVMNRAAFDPTTGLVGGKLPVVLDHVMSKFRLTIAFGGSLSAETYSIESVILRGTKLDGTYDFSSFATASAVASDILMHPTADGTNTFYEAIVVPQAMDDDELVVVIKNNATSNCFTFKYSLSNAKINGSAFDSYESTKVYSLTLMLNTNELNASPLTVADWGDGGTITAVADEHKTDWDNDTEIKLRKANDFWEFVKRVNEGNTFSGRTFTLACDITPSEKPAEYSTVSLPLGSFAGTFDGGGHTVDFGTVTDSYTATANGQTRQLAGFCLTNSGTIKSLKVKGSLSGNGSYSENRDGTTSFSLYGGGIVENNTGRILGCEFTGSVSMTAGATNNYRYWLFITIYGTASPAAYAGGIAARNSGTIDGCSVVGSTVYSYSNPATYDNNGTNNTDERSGGIVAYNGGTVTLCAVRETTLTMRDGYAGGIVGYHNSGSVKGCYSADITFGGGSGNGRGGITGRGTSNVSYCRYLSGDTNRVCGDSNAAPSNCGTFSSASDLNTNYISAMNSNATGTLYQFVSGGTDYPAITAK